MTESIIEKIRKLVAHERSARDIGSLAEAETFAAHIQSLLVHHKISMDKVAAEARDSGDPIGDSSTSLTTSNIEKWINALAFGVGTNYFCKVVGEINQLGKARITFIGREVDRLAASSMFDYLHFRAVTLVRRYVELKTPSIADLQTMCEAQLLRRRPKVIVNLRKKLQRDARADYLLGFAYAIQVRLAEGRKSFEAKASTELILQDREAIERYTAEAFNIRKDDCKMPRLKDPVAARAGFSAGSQVALSNRPSLSASSNSSAN